MNMDGELRQQVIARDRGKCVRCGADHTNTPMSVHHRKLRSQGGRDVLSNLILLCGSGTTGCHGWVHHNRREAQVMGWIVSAYADTEQVSLCRARFRMDYGTYVWLTDKGRVLVERPDGVDEEHEGEAQRPEPAEVEAAAAGVRDLVEGGEREERAGEQEQDEADNVHG